jgi:hypothetical protein
MDFLATKKAAAVVTLAASKENSRRIRRLQCAFQKLL